MNEELEARPTGNEVAAATRYRNHDQRVAALVGRTVAKGGRREFTAMVNELVEQSRGEMVMDLLEEDVKGKFKQAMSRGIKAGDRTAMNIYAKLLKLDATEHKVIVEFMHSMGVKSEDDLRRFVQTAQSVEGTGPHEGADRCASYLEKYFDVFPDQRETIIRRLGGLVAVG